MEATLCQWSDLCMMKDYEPTDMVNFAVASSAIKHTIHGDGNITDDADTIRSLMDMSFDIKKITEKEWIINENT